MASQSVVLKKYAWLHTRGSDDSCLPIDVTVMSRVPEHPQYDWEVSGTISDLQFVLLTTESLKQLNALECG